MAPRQWRRSPSHPVELDRLIDELAIGSGELGVELVDVAGNVDTVSERLAEQAHVFARLRDDAEAMRRENRDAARAATGAQLSTNQATAHVREFEQVLASSLGSLQAMVGWVKTVGDQMQDLAQAVDSIMSIAREVDAIARQTHLLALNAKIEAARVGSAGAGFAVIASSVRELADKTITAAADIDSTLGGLAVQIRELGEGGADARERAESAQRGTETIAHTSTAMAAAVLDLDQHVSGMSTATTHSGAKVDHLVDSLTTLAVGVEDSSLELETARGRVNTLLGHVERLIGTSAKTGRPTVDSPYVALAQARAAEIERLFESALAGRTISLDHLFDEDYQPIPGTDPQQFLARFTELTDTLMPGLFEPLKEADPQLRYAVATDRNGYIGTHNLSVSKPQGSDPSWNDANCRNRRFFDGRTELAAAHNTEPFLLQAYRRPMGNGKHALMKDVAAPITIQNRHWGAVRIGYVTS